MRLSIEQLKGLVKGGHLDSRKENVRGICPKCNEDEFGISIKDNHRFGCYRQKKCGFKGNIFTLLQFLGKLNEFLRDEDSFYDRKPGALVNKLGNQELDLDANTITLPIGFKRVFQDEYLDSRGFESYDRFVVGRTKLDLDLLKYIIFVIREQGEVKGWVGRHEWTKREIDEYNKTAERKILRYKNSETDFSKLVEGFEDITENTTTLILVEGLFDKESVDRKMELPFQEDIKCCCTFKCQLSPQQLEKIKTRGKNITTIILFYDPDVLKKTLNLASELELKFPDVLVVDNETDKDPGDMNTTELFEQLISHSVPASKIRMKKLTKKELN